jgi:hypothetical protein
VFYGQPELGLSRTAQRQLSNPTSCAHNQISAEGTKRTGGPLFFAKNVCLGLLIQSVNQTIARYTCKRQSLAALRARLNMVVIRLLDHAADIYYDKNIIPVQSSNFSLDKYHGLHQLSRFLCGKGIQSPAPFN